jgi:biotin carboxyl carrier protein
MNVTYVCDGVSYALTLEAQADGTYRAVIGERGYIFRALPQRNGSVILAFGGERLVTSVRAVGGDRHVAVGGGAYVLSLPQRSARQRVAVAGSGDVTAQMPGQIRDVIAREGETVERGQPILLLEAMKMEIRVTAPVDGTVKRLHVKPGDIVERGQRLAEIG